MAGRKRKTYHHDNDEDSNRSNNSESKKPNKKIRKNSNSSEDDLEIEKEETMQKCVEAKDDENADDDEDDSESEEEESKTIKISHTSEDSGDEEKDPFKIEICTRFGAWEKLMNGIPVKQRNFIVRQYNYKRLHFTVATQICIKDLHNYLCKSFGDANKNQPELYNTLISICKYTMMNELEIAALIVYLKMYAVKRLKSTASYYGIITQVYYYALYIKENLSTADYFDELLVGQTCFDLYELTYKDWKKINKECEESFNLLKLKDINNKFSSLIQVKEKIMIPSHESMDKLVAEIIKTSNPKGNRENNFVEGDPCKFVSKVPTKIEPELYNTTEVNGNFNKNREEFNVPDLYPTPSGIHSPPLSCNSTHLIFPFAGIPSNIQLFSHTFSNNHINSVHGLDSSLF